MRRPIEFDRLKKVRDMVGDDDDDTQLLKEMLDAATDYVRSFDWSPAIQEIFYGDGVGGVVAVFLFQFVEKIQDTDEFLWVVVGDVPSAYFVVDDAPNATVALEVYCDLMEEWCAAVRNGDSLDDVFPVRAPNDREHAAMLERRVRFIRDEIIV